MLQISVSGNPLQWALTTSISFGRFMSESLDWEEWSAFTYNRYLEEVEKYSKPSSVAEKKAYFEAHFKKRRAAALLEQQNATASNSSETNTEHKDDATQRNSKPCEKKSEVSSSKLLTNTCASKGVPPAQIMHIQLKNSEKTPNSKRSAMDPSNKRRS